MKRETKVGTRWLSLFMSAIQSPLVVTLYSLSGVRNYLKEALVNVITVHAEVKSYSHEDTFPSFFLFSPCFVELLSVTSQVFTVSKDLVPRVLSKIVESVADEMCRLMQCVSSFSKNGALQVLLDTFAQITKP